MMIVTFTKFACAHWHVISVACKMTCEQLTSYTQNQWITCKYSMMHASVKLKLSCTVATYNFKINIRDCVSLYLQFWLFNS